MGGHLRGTLQGICTAMLYVNLGTCCCAVRALPNTRSAQYALCHQNEVLCELLPHRCWQLQAPELCKAFNACYYGCQRMGCHMQGVLMGKNSHLHACSLVC